MLAWLCSESQVLISFPSENKKRSGEHIFEIHVFNFRETLRETLVHSTRVISNHDWRTVFPDNIKTLREAVLFGQKANDK